MCLCTICRYRSRQRITLTLHHGKCPRVVSPHNQSVPHTIIGWRFSQHTACGHAEEANQRAEQSESESQRGGCNALRACLYFDTPHQTYKHKHIIHPSNYCINLFYVRPEPPQRRTVTLQRAKPFVCLSARRHRRTVIVCLHLNRLS